MGSNPIFQTPPDLVEMFSARCSAYAEALVLAILKAYRTLADSQFGTHLHYRRGQLDQAALMGKVE